jgi:hypothetical protein
MLRGQVTTIYNLGRKTPYHATSPPQFVKNGRV